MADTDRGALFDRFPSQSESVHGGALFDSGFTLQTLEQAHGRLHDQFGISRTEESHGERFDDFGWRELPTIHGSLFDEDFASEADGEAHGSWFDVFAGGNQVRYVIEGRDYEGTVLNTERDFALVQPAGGGDPVEVGLSQFLAYRTPNKDQASPEIPASTAQAPSAHSADAHGGPRATAPSPGRPDSPTPRGQHTDARAGIPEGIMDSTLHLKSLPDDLDVEKAHLPSSRLPTFSAFGGNDVLKEVGATERAIQGEANAAAQSGAPKEGSAKTWCSSCKATREKAAHGECPSCGGKLVAKTADDRLDEIAKAFGAPADPNPGGQTLTVAAAGHHASTQAASDPPGPEVPVREHASTDRVSDQAGPRECPHCHQALDELDEKTREGQSHKCAGTGLDLLKALA